MRPSLRFLSPLNEILPDLFRVSSLAENLRFAATVALSLTRSQARVNGKRDQGLTDPPLSEAE